MIVSDGDHTRAALVMPRVDALPNIENNILRLIERLAFSVAGNVVIHKHLSTVVNNKHFLFLLDGDLTEKRPCAVCNALSGRCIIACVSTLHLTLMVSSTLHLTLTIQLAMWPIIN